MTRKAVSEEVACLHCSEPGFVRQEHVIRADRHLTNCYCGLCDHAWTMAQEERRKAPRIHHASGRERLR